MIRFCVSKGRKGRFIYTDTSFYCLPRYYPKTYGIAAFSGDAYGDYPTLIDFLENAK